MRARNNNKKLYTYVYKLENSIKKIPMKKKAGKQNRKDLGQSKGKS